MNFDEYIGQAGKLSGVKRTILERLWNEGGPEFPRGWVRSDELLRLTGQKYFDRRIRELNDEQGTDIEYAKIGGKDSYRLKSPVVEGGIPRGYLTRKEKLLLFRSQDYKCQICGKAIDPSGKGKAAPQADHKVPLIRGGSHEFKNWQTLCNECNVAKRGACRDCEEDCEQCPWAYPERFGAVVTVGLPRDLYQAALDRTERRSRPEVGAVLADALRDKLREE